MSVAQGLAVCLECHISIQYNTSNSIHIQRHRVRPEPGPNTQNKPRELGLKARTACFVPTSDVNLSKVSEVLFDLAASFQE